VVTLELALSTTCAYCAETPVIGLIAEYRLSREVSVTERQEDKPLGRWKRLGKTSPPTTVAAVINFCSGEAKLPDKGRLLVATP
jgi:hypothetical protein